jgi:RHS repeat-associated core domain
MYVANTHLKPVIGLDLHFVNLPFPFVPLPHPYIGLVIDPFDYIPFIGATVKVNGVPRGNTDTMGMIITFIHIPFGAGFTLLPMIGHDSQNFFGSKRVHIDGAPMSGAGYVLMTCNDIGIPLSFTPGKKFKPIPSLYLPTSFCIPLQWGKPVRVGGPLVPNFSLMALLKAFAFGSALKIFGKLGGRALKALNKKVLKKFKSTQKLSKKLCKMGFEPVDLVTGRVNYEYTDFELPGPMPLEWTRNWDSDSAATGLLGHGVHLCYERAVHLVADEGCLAVTMDDGRMAAFPLLYYGESYYHPQEKIKLTRKQNGHFLLEDFEAAQYLHFNHHVQEGVWQLSFIGNYNGNRIQMHYAGRVLRAITDCAGRQLHFNLDKQNRITQVTVKHRDVEQVLVSYAYNEGGDMISIGDALGQATTMEYRDHLMIKKTDRNGQSFYWEYDDKRRCVHTWGDGGLLEGWIAYGNGYNTITNSVGEISTLFYDEDNLCVQETDHYGNYTYTEYTENYDVYREIDEAGNITGYAYDNLGRLTHTILPDGSTIQVQYNEYNQPVLMINADGTSETFGYDVQRRLRFVNSPNGKVVAYHYNEEGQLATVVESGNRKTFIQYDEDENVASIQLPDGATERWKYDARGRCIQASNANGETRYYEFDALDRITNLYLPDGNHIKLEYNAYEEITRATDKFGQMQFEYTPLGKVKKTRQGNSEQQFLYDTEERLITMINEAGNHYHFEYNKRGEVVAETGFDGLSYRHELDPTGRILKTIRPGGRFTQYEYDNDDNVVRTAFHDGSWEAFQYDKEGNLIEASNEHSTVRFTWNKQGQLVKEEQNGYTIHYEIDKEGERTRITSSLGANIELQRDVMSRVTAIRAAMQTSAWQARRMYNAHGLETERQMPGGLTSQWQYDQASRPTEHKLSSGQVVYSWKKNAWDAHDRLSGIFDALAHAHTYFKHDALNNLVFAQYADNSIVHRAADKAGHFYETPGKTDRNYDAAGALQESEKYFYKYDEEGNLISKTGKATNRKTYYEWYASGMLKKVIRPDGKTVTFTYDALGRRISKQYDGVITRWVWNGHVPLHEWTYKEHEKPQAIVNEWGDISYDREEPNPQNQPDSGHITWIFDDDECIIPIAKIQHGKTYSITADHIGTPQYMFDEQGKKVWEGSLDIYGRIRTLQGSRSDLPFRFQGQYEDVETGLYYNWFRYFSPEEGQYISQDPISIGGGLRLYGYVNDPNAWVDHLGLAKAKAAKPHQHMNGVRARVKVGRRTGVFDSLPSKKLHAEMRGLDWFLDNGGIEGKNVTFSHVFGKMRPGPDKLVPVCVDCRTDMFKKLMDGGAKSVTIPVQIGKRSYKPIKIPSENFQKVYQELLPIKGINKRYSYRRSKKAWAVLKKYQCK